MQKIHDSKFLIVVDKDLRINGFTEIGEPGSYFTIDNEFNLTKNIIGNHIGIIIPDILSLLEYKNEEFNFIKLDTELKGYLYPVEKSKDIKSKVDIILDKIKNNKINDNNNYQAQIDEDSQNIIMEFNELMKEIHSQNIKPISVFYKIKLYTFLDGKYKYYKIYVTNDIITDNELGNSKQTEDALLKITNKELESGISRKETKKKIKIKIKEN